MKLLSEHLPDAELAAFYRDLLASEARHHTTFIDLACLLEDRATVTERLGELALHEASVIASAAACRTSCVVSGALMIWLNSSEASTRSPTWISAWARL